MSACTYEEGNNGLVSRLYDGDKFIDSHLGYLDARPDDAEFPKLTTLCLGVDDVGSYAKRYFDRENERYSDYFYVQTKYDTFNASPLIGLLVSGISDDNQCIFVRSRISNEKNIPKVTSPIAALKRKMTSAHRISMIATLEEQVEMSTSVAKFDPKNLELVLFFSSILASHGSGFKGTELILFLEILMREFSFKATYGDGVKPPKINFEKYEFPSEMAHMKIPFLSPMAMDKWQDGLQSELERIFGAYLGVATPSLSTEAADLVIADVEDKVVLVGECKLYSYPLDAGELRDIVKKKFDKFPKCNTLLVLSTEFTSLPSFGGCEYCTWKIKPSDVKDDGAVDGSEFVITKVNNEQNANSAKHIILIGLKEIYSESDYEKFKNMIQVSTERKEKKAKLSMVERFNSRFMRKGTFEETGSE
jgi:hypothetical protein